MRAALAVLFVLLPHIGLAHPVLGEGKATPAGRCYPDHKEAKLWWLAPQGVDLKRGHGKPAAIFTTFLYQGTRATGDAGQQWGGSVLQFVLDFQSISGRVEKARTFLGQGHRVKHLAPAEVNAEVVFAGIQTGGREAGGSATRGIEEVATEASFSLALSPEEGVALRSAWEADSVILSVNVVASVFAYQSRPGKNDENPPDLMPILVEAVTVSLDPNDEDVFRVLSLDATMPAGYTSLDIGCSEMGGELSFSDIARVLVVVEAEAVNGDRVSKQIRFITGVASPQTVRFNQALKLDAGYEISIMKVFSSGAVEQKEIRRVGTWQGFVDVCSTRVGAERELDPRMLY